MVYREIGGNSCSASWLAMVRQKDGGLSSVSMVVHGRLAAAALAKVGRHSSRMVISLGRLLSLLKMEDW